MQPEFEIWRFDAEHGRFVIQRDPDGGFVLTAESSIMDEHEILARGSWHEVVDCIVHRKTNFLPWDQIDPSAVSSLVSQPARWWRPQWVRANANVWNLGKKKSSEAPPQIPW
jgi:hypothetical protein